MKKNIRYTLSIALLFVFAVIFAGTALAVGSAEKISPPQSGNYETIEGVLTIKESHGDFIIRTPGRAQRFSVRAGAGAVEITRNGKPARYNELKVSDSVQVKYDPSNRKVIAIHARTTAENSGGSQIGGYKTVNVVLDVKECA